MVAATSALRQHQSRRLSGERCVALGRILQNKAGLQAASNRTGHHVARLPDILANRVLGRGGTRATSNVRNVYAYGPPALVDHQRCASPELLSALSQRMSPSLMIAFSQRSVE